MSHFLITGGAGFIGSHLADRMASRGHIVTILDNLSRSGTERNCSWLLARHPQQLRLIRDSIQKHDILDAAMQEADVVFHLAGQVAVTTSLIDPLTDFDTNASGTLSVLESARRSHRSPIVVFGSTNKVYGSLLHVPLVEQQTRYAYDGITGISETEPLDPASPYGCSKGAADCYVRDYARSFGLRTVVLRQSCIFGPRQYGHADQGWIAWVCAQAIGGQTVTLYGSGKQVRDVLYISDLLDLYERVVERIAVTAGMTFNIGGGPDNTISLLELLYGLRRYHGIDTRCEHAEWRVGDQRAYVSDISRAERELAWKPRVDVWQGVAQLVDWLRNGE